MIKVAKRQRNGQPTEETEPKEATLKPCFSQPSSPDKRQSSMSPAPASSSSGSDDDSMTDFNSPKRRKIYRHRRYQAFSSSQTTRVEACAAAAADTTDCGGLADGASCVSSSGDTITCPSCGQAISTSSMFSQGRVFTLNEVKRIVSGALREQDSKLRIEYEKRLQQELQKQYMSFVQSQQEASRPSDYSYIS